MSSLLLILLSSYACQMLQATRRRLPPGPVPLPVIGNLLDVASRLPPRSLARLAERYGPLMMLRLGSAVVIVASSPAAAREVLRTHNGSITGRNAPDAWNGAGHAANSVFVLPPRRRWRALRQVGTEHLLSPRRLDALRPAVRAAVLEMRRRVSESTAAPVEVGRVAFEAMADLMWRAMFSSGLDVATLGELHGVAREAVLLALTPNVSDFFPTLAALDLQGVRRGMATQMGRVYELIDQEIDKRRRGPETGSRDLLEVMLETDQGNIDGVVMNRDTMRAFLTTCVECSDIDNLPYHQAVVKETLRLHAVVPLVPNKVENPVEIHGHTIPKGSTVIVNLWAIHRSAEVRTDPSKFIPERFLGKEFHFQGTEDFEFMPFSAGRRICLGLPLATRMLHVLLGSLLKDFEWTLPEKAMENGLDMSEKLGLTMSMATPLDAIVKGM
ncbi:unnamed protein product [Urochloa decumbens]|uniref:Uncharacterized protein n=1 Tax=Urochloa decumbens TaxID=240449 RepID=A0ABC9CM56_9POAL